MTSTELRRRLGLSPEPARKLSRRQKLIREYGSYQAAMDAEFRSQQGGDLLALLALTTPHKPRRTSGGTRGSSVTDGSGTR